MGIETRWLTISRCAQPPRELKASNGRDRNMRGAKEPPLQALSGGGVAAHIEALSQKQQTGD